MRGSPALSRWLCAALLYVAVARCMPAVVCRKADAAMQCSCGVAGDVRVERQQRADHHPPALACVRAHAPRTMPLATQKCNAGVAVRF